MKTHIINGVEYECAVHTEFNSMAKITIPYGWRVLRFEEVMMLWNEYRDEFEFTGVGDDIFQEVVQNPLVDMRGRRPFWHVWIRQADNYLNLCGNDWGSHNDSVILGVRFCRDVKQ